MVTEHATLIFVPPGEGGGNKIVWELLQTRIEEMGFSNKQKWAVSSDLYSPTTRSIGDRKKISTITDTNNSKSIFIINSNGAVAKAGREFEKMALKDLIPLCYNKPRVTKITGSQWSGENGVIRVGWLSFQGSSKGFVIELLMNGNRSDVDFLELNVLGQNEFPAQRFELKGGNEDWKERITRLHALLQQVTSK